MSIFRALNNVFNSNSKVSSAPLQQSSSNSTSTSSSASTITDKKNGPSLNNFQSSWLAIRNSLTSPNHRHSTLQSTQIRQNLDLIWECLAIENNIPTSNNVSSSPTLNPSSNTVGECVEYFLQNNIPSSLVSLSLPDQPIGVKGLVISFFISIVVFLDESFVITPKVYKPLVRLLRSCVEPELDLDDGDDGGWRTKESEYEEAVVELMCYLCSRIKTYPQLLNVFLQTGSRLLQSQSNYQSLTSPSRDFSVSESSTSSNNTAQLTSQPSQRKFVHFSPEFRPSSPSISIRSAIESAMEGSNLPPSESSLSPTKTSSASKALPHSPPLSEPALRSDSDMLIFSYLLRFIHREGRTGDLARAGLLFLMELAMGRRKLVTTNVASKDSNSPDTQTEDSISMAFGEWVLDSDFADVLGAGLGAAYGLLPSKLVITPRDPSGGDEHGGMVLGGMGTHLSEDQPDNGQTAEEREREQRRERLLIGLGVSGSDDFRAQMNLFLKLIEFAQDVLRNTSPSILEHYTSASNALYPGPLTPTIDSFDPSTENRYSDPSPTPSEIIASAISSSVLISIRKLFLNAIIYPSLLECSENDGSAVAVMSYLEAILTILETDSEISDSFLRFLMAEDEEELELGDAKSKYHEINRLASPGDIIYLDTSGETKKRRRKSGAIQIIQAEFNQAKSGGRRRAYGDTLTSETGVVYHNSFGRFTLKDLLVNSVQSPDSRTATAGLKLLHIILVKHDRYALPLLDITPDPSATAFPFPHQVEDEISSGPNWFPTSRSGSISAATAIWDGGKSEDNENEEFVYPLKGSSGKIESNADDENEFRYPGADSSSENAPPTQTDEDEEEVEEFTYPIKESTKSQQSKPSYANTQNNNFLTPFSAKASFSNLSWMRKSPCPTYRSHRAELDHLAHLIELIEPSRAALKADSAQGSLSTAFGHYLLDAEAELTGTATFRRGLLLDYVSASVLPELSSRNKFELLSPNPGTSTKRSDLDLIDNPVIRHRLSPDTSLLSGLLESLAKFFVQPPELNLVLTGCVATLASCPTRSLDGWMVPSSLRGNFDEEDDDERFLSMSRASYVNLTDDLDEGDDRSIDFVVEEYSINAAQDPVETPRKDSIKDLKSLRTSEGDSILEVYRKLAEQVAGYRTSINGFDRFLKERRQGLIFVENLEDALDSSPNTVMLGVVNEEEKKSKELISASQAIREDAESNRKKHVVEPRNPSKAKDVSTFFSSLFKASNNTTKSSSSSSPSPSPSSINAKRSNGPVAVREEPPMTPDKAFQTFRPFSDHYQKTGSIKLTVVPVETPASIRKSLKRLDDQRGGDQKGLFEDEDEGEDEGPETPTKKTRNGTSLKKEGGSERNKKPKKTFLSLDLSKTSDESDDDDDGLSLRRSGENDGDLDSKSRKKISLSMLLDNVVVLEEAIKELGAILSARKSLGIDPVRFL